MQPPGGGADGASAHAPCPQSWLAPSPAPNLMLLQSAPKEEQSQRTVSTVMAGPRSPKVYARRPEATDSVAAVASYAVGAPCGI